VVAAAALFSGCSEDISLKSDSGAASPSASDAAPPPPPPPCFAAGTPIATPRGEIPIEAIQEGESVLAYDDVAHIVVLDTVTSRALHPHRSTGELHLASDRVLHVTPEHPVYLPDERRYVPAREIGIDSRLLSLRKDRETSSAISLGFSTDDSSKDEIVYDLTIAVHHNYFAGGILVHNKELCRPCTCGACPDVSVECQPLMMPLHGIGTSDSGSDAGVPCRWSLPSPPANVILDFEKFNVRAELDGLVDELLYTTASNCNAGAWSFDDPNDPRAIVACPLLCDRLRRARLVRVDAELGCVRRVPH
jgi:hypothetical protein